MFYVNIKYIEFAWVKAIAMLKGIIVVFLRLQVEK